MLRLQVDDQHGRGDEDIAAYGQNRQPRRNMQCQRNRGNRQRDKGRRQEDFIRHRVEKGSQHGFLPKFSGDKAVQTVANRRQQKQDGCRFRVAVNEQDDKTRDEKHSQDGQLIGKRQLTDILGNQVSPFRSNYLSITVFILARFF